jgi:hypothetical protein
MAPVVIGVIDDGIAFAQARFRNRANQTRVAFAWRQTVPTGGVFLDKNRIDALFARCTHGGMLDEDEVYQRSDWIDFRRATHWSAAARAAHGTHVMDLAGGYAPAEDRNDRPIVCVQLPTEVTADTGHATHSKYPLEAMHYILRCADRLAREAGVDYLPVVINFSYGAIAGPHDGTSVFESQVDQIVARRKARFGPLALEVVLPAGNSHLSRCHAELSFAEKDEVQCLNWRVQPDDRAQSILEIWTPCRTGPAGGSRVEVTVTSPTGEGHSLGEVPGPPAQWKAASGAVYAQLQYGIPTAGGRGMFLMALQPTADLNPANVIAPAGIWKVHLRNICLSPAEVVQAWIERGDTPFGYPLRGRQSYFDEACCIRHDHAGRETEAADPDDSPCSVKRQSLINSIATGRRPVVMGGLLRKEMKVPKYSAGGPILPRCGSDEVDPYRPDAVTVSDDSHVHRGVLAAGSRSGSVVAISGTSVAAPQIARWIADRLAQRNPALPGDRAAVQREATDQEAAAQRPKIPPLPALRYGAGRIEIPYPPIAQSILDPDVPRPRFVVR